MKKIFCLVLLLSVCRANPAFAGDGATIVLKSGIVIYIQNGFNQLIAGMKNLRQKGTENYPVEINIESTSFFINLGEVAVLCRDTCSSMKLEFPKAKDKS